MAPLMEKEKACITESIADSLQLYVREERERTDYS